MKNRLTKKLSVAAYLVDILGELSKQLVFLLCFINNIFYYDTKGKVFSTLYCIFLKISYCFLGVSSSQPSMHQPQFSSGWKSIIIKNYFFNWKYKLFRHVGLVEKGWLWNASLLLRLLVKKKHNVNSVIGQVSIALS
jgi:hypothetical protein